MAESDEKLNEIGHTLLNKFIHTDCTFYDSDRENGQIIAFSAQEIGYDKKRYGTFFRIILSKKISNDQELIQSDPISCPQNQKGNN